MPIDAPILPVQAFVNNSDAFFQADINDGIVGFRHAPPTTSLDRGTFNYAAYNAYALNGNNPPSFEGFVFQAFDQATVDDILSALAATGWESGYLDLSGGTNAAPSPVSVHADGRVTITFASLAFTTGIDLRFGSAVPDTNIYPDASIALAASDSSVGGGGALTIRIGTSG